MFLKLQLFEQYLLAYIFSSNRSSIRFFVDNGIGLFVGFLTNCLLQFLRCDPGRVPRPRECAPRETEIFLLFIMSASIFYCLLTITVRAIGSRY